MESGFFADQQSAHVALGKAIDILIRINSEDHCRFIDLRRRRRLHQNTINGIIGIQIGNDFENIFGGAVCGHGDHFGFDTGFAAGTHFVAHINCAGRIIPHQHHCQTHFAPGFRRQFSSYLSSFQIDLPGNRFAIDDFCGHDIVPPELNWSHVIREI